MRDPARIDKFCRDLADLWHKVPDWRFGQLVSNIAREYMSDYGADLFYIEDNNLMKYMKKLFS